MKISLCFVLLIFSCLAMGNEKKYDAMEALYECTTTLVSDKVGANHAVVIDSYLGFKQFINSKLDPWMLKAVYEASNQTLSKYALVKKHAHFPINEYRDLFYDKLKSLLVERAGYSTDKYEYCEWEMQTIIEKLRENKTYQFYNDEFRSFLRYYGLPMNLRASNDYLFMLMFLGGDYQKGKRGTCQEFVVESDLKVSKVTLCG